MINASPESFSVHLVGTIFFLDLSEASCSHLIRWICAVTSIQKVAGSSSTPKPWLSSAYDGVVSQPVRQLGEIEPEIEEPFSGWWFEGLFFTFIPSLSSFATCHHAEPYGEANFTQF